jgi:segregation and condensation protein B
MERSEKVSESPTDATNDPSVGDGPIMEAQADIRRTFVGSEEAAEVLGGPDAGGVAGSDMETEETDQELQPSGDLPPLRTLLEAVLLVVDEPVTDMTLAQVLECPRDDVAEALQALADEYDADHRGFQLRNIAGGWRLYTRAECASVVERFVLDGQQARLTQAALETLSVVAYRQPVSRARVSAVRGVNVDGVMRTLLARGLVEEAGSEPETGAILYRTTGYFLERLGLSSLDELPELAQYVPEIHAIDSLDDHASS